MAAARVSSRRMDAPLDWYFDFISPFAYLQWRRLRRDHPDVALAPKPLLFAAILDRVGQPRPRGNPAEAAPTYRIVLWQAREAGIPLAFPPAHPFNPLPALRLCLAAPDRIAAIDAIFTHFGNTAVRPTASRCWPASRHRWASTTRPPRSPATR